MNEAAQILHDYNTRLSVEMEDRKKLTQMLKDFQAEQKELLLQAEQRLEVNHYCCALIQNSINF